MSIPTLLEVEIEDQFEHLNKVEFGSEQYKAGVDGLTKLIDRSMEINKIEYEAEEERKNREIDNEFKQKQMDEEKKSRWVQHAISVASIILPIAAAVWGTKASFKFEETGTITTVMGRGWINKLLPKK